MTDIPIPSEDDFKKLSDPRDFVEEALADGLIKDGDTRSTHERNYVPVGQRDNWVEAAIQAIKQMVFAEEIDSWERTNEKRLSNLFVYFPDQYEMLCEELWAARENVKQLRW